MFSNVINLQTFSIQQSFPDYCVLYIDSKQVEKDIFSLTSNVMRWSDNIWIFHMEPCKKYWEFQAQKLQIDIYEVFDQILAQTFGESYICVSAFHPWQGLVFLSFLISKKSSGFHTLQSVMSQKIYRQISWKDWFAPLPILENHFTKLKVSKFKASEFRSKQRQLKRFIKRMDLNGPFDLKQADHAAIGRRFSASLGKVWKWTFHEFSEKSSSQMDIFTDLKQLTDLEDFPWVCFEVKNSPKVERHLEYPTNLWEVVESLLKEDFEKLCSSTDWSRFEKVLTLSWTITLYSLEKVSIDISFRHPYSLHQEAQSEFKTALYQAYYAYIDFMTQLKGRETDLDLPEEIPFLGWQLEVSKRFYQSPHVMEILSAQTESCEMDLILNLQNKLPRAFESFDLCPDFFPISSFKSLSQNSKIKARGGRRIPHTSTTKQRRDWSFGTGSKDRSLKIEDIDFPLQPWIKAASKRPFFFYKKPFPISPPLNPLFLERTSKDWWERENLKDMGRDYFKIEWKNQWIWIFKDYLGRWFQHGLFS